MRKSIFANQFPSFTPDPKGSEANWLAADISLIEPYPFSRFDPLRVNLFRKKCLR
jgi:hypothetical protein